MQKIVLNNTLKVYAPGRINLIGEHLDYNGGSVLPAAINLNIELSFKLNNSKIASIWSENYNEGFSINLLDIKHSEKQWENYILGVLFFFEKKVSGCLVGFDCSIKSNLPIGAGISSSAALACGFAKGINELLSLQLSDNDLIEIARNAEHFLSLIHI